MHQCRAGVERDRLRDQLPDLAELLALAVGAGEGALGALDRVTRTAATKVTFADLDDAEIDAYVATGEPDHVAGAFTIDGLGGPYVTRIDGDPHNVIGLSLPLLREMLRGLGIAWHDLWEPTPLG